LAIRRGFRAARFLDGKGKTLRNTIIVVEGTKIARIGGSVPLGAIVYDLTSFTVSPGLDRYGHASLLPLR
jgi:imidazolonepropionase-like amidohydrolase